MQELKICTSTPNYIVRAHCSKSAPDFKKMYQYKKERERERNPQNPAAGQLTVFLGPDHLTSVGLIRKSLDFIKSQMLYPQHLRCLRRYLYEKLPMHTIKKLRLSLVKRLILFYFMGRFVCLNACMCAQVCGAYRASGCKIVRSPGSGVTGSCAHLM